MRVRTSDRPAVARRRSDAGRAAALNNVAGVGDRTTARRRNQAGATALALPGEVAQTSSVLLLPAPGGPTAGATTVDRPSGGPLRAPTGERIVAPRRNVHPKLLLGAADVSAVTAGLLVAYALAPSFSGPGPRSASAYGVLGVAAPVLWVAALARYRLYQAHHAQPVAEELSRLLHAGALAPAGVAVTAFALKVDVARAWLVLSFLFGTGALVLERAVARRVFDRWRRSRRLVRRVIVVGADEHGLALTGALGARAGLGYEVIGIVDDGFPPGSMVREGYRTLGGLDQINELVDATAADGIIVSVGALTAERLDFVTRAMAASGVHVELSAPLRGFSADRLTLRSLGDQFTVVHVRPRVDSRRRAVVKRSVDVVLAVVGLTLTDTMLLVLAVMIKLDSPGPVLFRQRRVGRGGTPFQLVKLRSMVADAEELLESMRHLNEADGPLFKVRGDPRITRIGRYIRNLSLDELPQLWNVLRGEMSLVGPRPALPEEIRGWTPELHQRLQVRPGITGMWQVSGRSEATFDDYVHLDLFYVDNWSLALDLKILLRTIPSVLCQRGAH